MPRLDGYDLAVKLREKQPDLPVLFVSGYPDRLAQGVRELPENAEFLEKPFTLDMLLAKIEATLRGVQAKASSANAGGALPGSAQGLSSPAPTS